MNRFAPQRLTRQVLGEDRSCYDAYCMGMLAENEVCGECSRYKDIVVKKKSQDLMGKTYRCHRKRKWEVDDLPDASSPTPLPPINNQLRLLSLTCTGRRNPIPAHWPKSACAMERSSNDRNDSDSCGKRFFLVTHSSPSIPVFRSMN